MKLDSYKNKFNDREINPSTQAWSKLEERLDASDKKAIPLWYWIAGVAAVLLLAVTIVKFSPVQSNPVENTEWSVTEDQSNEQPLINKDLFIEEEIESEKSSSTMNEELVKANHKDEPAGIKATVSKVKMLDPKFSQRDEVVVSATIDNQHKKEVDVNTVVKEPKINEQQVLIAQVENSNIKKELSIKTADQEVDELLSELLNESDINKEEAVYTVNPESLLREAEWDIQIEQENKIQNWIDKGFNQVKKEAVALVSKK
ncbi:hypothetical protein I5168_01350 [Nonlabens sp. SCSIO 43208]|uniref:hypothetical protein n=1 Tax=Nonlabens sp. SCSIO 43208 TaxID=2793009 RepID=UPI003D6AC565